MPPETQPESRLASEVLALVGLNPGTVLTSDKAEAAFSRATKKQLLDCAQRLGITASRSSRRSSSPRGSSRRWPGWSCRAARPSTRRSRSSRPRFRELARSRPSSIWTRRRDRSDAPEAFLGLRQNWMTAMVVDPDRMFVYWEVTDDAVATARAGLGAGGAQRLAEPARLRHQRPSVRRYERARPISTTGWSDPIASGSSPSVSRPPTPASRSG